MRNVMSANFLKLAIYSASSLVISTSSFAQSNCVEKAMMVEKKLSCAGSESCAKKYPWLSVDSFKSNISKDELNQVIAKYIHGSETRTDSQGKPYQSWWQNSEDQLSATKQGNNVAFIYENHGDKTRPKGINLVVVDTQAKKSVAEIKLFDSDSGTQIYKWSMAFSDDQRKVIINLQENFKLDRTAVVDLNRKTVNIFNIKSRQLHKNLIYGNTSGKTYSDSKLVTLDLNTLKISPLLGQIANENDFGYVWPDADLAGSGSNTYVLSTGQLLSRLSTANLYSENGSNQMLILSGGDSNSEAYQVKLQNICAPIQQINNDLDNNKLTFDEQSCRFNEMGTSAKLANTLLVKATNNRLTINDSLAFSTLIKSRFAKQFPNLSSYLVAMASMDHRLNGVLNANRKYGQLIAYSPAAESLSCLKGKAVDRQVEWRDQSELFNGGVAHFQESRQLLNTMSPQLKNRVISAASDMSIGFYHDQSSLSDESYKKLITLQKKIILAENADTEIVFANTADLTTLLMASNKTFTLSNGNSDLVDYKTFTNMGLVVIDAGELFSQQEIEEMIGKIENSKKQMPVGTVVATKVKTINSTLGNFKVTAVVKVDSDNLRTELSYKK